MRGADEMTVSYAKDSDGDIKMTNLAGAKAIAAALEVNSALTSIGKNGLHLKDNGIGDGWSTIIGGVCASKVSKISSIDASGQDIGPAGAKAIGEAAIEGISDGSVSTGA